MSVSDLEDRLRELRLVEPEPGLAGRALESLHLTRHFRIAWRSAAAAALLAVGVGMSESRRPEPSQEGQVVEVEGVRLVIPAEARPSSKTVALAFVERRNLETRILQGDLR